MFSLLTRNGSGQGETAPAGQNSYLLDLNIDQILNKVTEGWDPECRSMFETFPSCKDDEDYRRAIYGDVKKEDVYSSLMEFYYKIIARSTYSERKEKN